MASSAIPRRSACWSPRHRPAGQQASWWRRSPGANNAIKRRQEDTVLRDLLLEPVDCFPHHILPFLVARPRNLHLRLQERRVRQREESMAGLPDHRIQKGNGSRYPRMISPRWHLRTTSPPPSAIHFTAQIHYCKNSPRSPMKGTKRKEGLQGGKGVGGPK